MADAKEEGKDAGSLADRLRRRGSQSLASGAPPPPRAVAPVRAPTRTTLEVPRDSNLPSPGATQVDRDTREFLKGLHLQERRFHERQLEQVRELERAAKTARRRATEHSRTLEELGRHTDYAKRALSQMGVDPDRRITDVPPLAGPHITQLEFFTVLENRAYIRISYDELQHHYNYEVIEPTLNDQERGILDFIRDILIRTMDGREALEGADPEEFLVQSAQRAILGHSILVDEVSKQRVFYYLVRDFIGYGPIDVLMHDPMIEDISCDGPRIPLYVFHRQYESIRTNIMWESDHLLDSYVIRLAQRSGKHISIADPLLDATLPDTSRLQASLSREVTTRGSSFTIRRFRSDPLTPPDLIRLGTFNAEMAAFFWFAMQEGSSLMLAGGTASGKTSTLNAVCQFIPPEKKIVSIEDTREVNLSHENWIAGLTRAGFGEVIGGKLAGAIDMYKLLEAALRQRPEYLIVGEVRGAEALTLFQAMATGHATYSTLHADSVPSAVYRLEKPPINVPRIMLQTLDALAIQVQVHLNQRMARRMKEVVEIVGIDPQTGDLLTNQVFEWDRTTDTHRYLGKSHILEAIMEKNNLTQEQMEQEWAQRTQLLEWMTRKGIRQIHDVATIIHAYYRNKAAVVAQMKEPVPVASAGAKDVR